jgi:hypothetical protein
VVSILYWAKLSRRCKPSQSTNNNQFALTDHKWSYINENLKTISVT